MGASANPPTVDVVLPCRDEAAALPDLLASFPPGLRPVVVDNGSRDGTAQVAAALGAQVVTETRPGYGAAVHAGLLAASPGPVAVLDGDGSLDPAELPDLIALLRQGLDEAYDAARERVERVERPSQAG